MKIVQVHSYLWFSELLLPFGIDLCSSMDDPPKQINNVKSIFYNFRAKKIHFFTIDLHPNTDTLK